MKFVVVAELLALFGSAAASPGSSTSTTTTTTTTTTTLGCSTPVGTDGFIGDGTCNNAIGTAAFVGGGYQNTADEYGSVIGGESNTAWDGSSVAGGHTNEATSASFIAGGQNNVAGTLAVILGGEANTASGAYSTILGGASNTASGESSFVAGGDTNTASADNAGALGSSAAATHTSSIVLGFNGDGSACASQGSGSVAVCADGGVFVNGVDITGDARALKEVDNDMRDLLAEEREAILRQTEFAMKSAKATNEKAIAFEASSQQMQDKLAEVENLVSRASALAASS